MKPLLLAIVLVMVVPVFAQAADEAGGYTEYKQGTGRVSTFFMALYEEFGQQVRVAEILFKCGYKKEADELNARTAIKQKEKLYALIDKDMKDNKLQSVMANLVAFEGTSSMQVGYRGGYRDSLSHLADMIPAKSYEVMCKSSLKTAREWLEEATR